MLGCIRRLRQNQVLYDKVVKRLSEPIVDEYPFERNHRNKEIFKALLNNESLTSVANTFSISTINCSNIAEGFCKRYTEIYCGNPISIDMLPLEPRTLHALHRNGIHTRYDIVAYFNRYKSFAGISGLGKLSQENLLNVLIKHNILNSLVADDKEGLFVIYNESKKSYKSEEGWCCLSKALIFRNKSSAEIECRLLSNDCSVVECELVVK